MKRSRSWLLSMLLLPVCAAAQVQTLKQSAQQAISTNPEVLARWHAFEASRGERGAAFGALLPRLDLSAGIGRDRSSDPLFQDNLHRSSNSVVLTQLLYDGFATSNDIKRLDHASLVRLYELYDVSEAVALEVARAYFDVLRYRNLVSMAEENYIRHRSVFEQIQRKANAGVGRRVDMEQASGRLALSESNLLTEISNLHDVSARFQRLVGAPPSKELQVPGALNKDLPPNVPNAVRIAIERNPALQAAIENVRSADRAARIRNAAYQPRFDLRLRSDRGNNLSGVPGSANNNSAEVVMSWNLFSGFSDRARTRQFAEQLNVTRELRDKACRDIRQTMTIAFNDTVKLVEQLTYLDQHQLAIEKARDAYRMQFDIGQRTLLDVLDTENELFQARRAYANAETDLNIAYARVHAGSGNLFPLLGLARAEIKDLPQASQNDGAESIERCPAEGPTSYIADKDALNERARELVRDSVQVNPGVNSAGAAAPAPMLPSPAGRPMQGEQSALLVSAPVQPSTGAALPESNGNAAAKKAIVDSLAAWTGAWNKLDVNAYLNAYAASFRPANGISRAAWADQRTAVLSNAKQVEVSVSKVQIEMLDASRAKTSFVQNYRSASYQDVVQKTLEWVKIGGDWKISKETSEPIPKAIP